MTGLLASVRNREEAALALQVGVDILDLKEPSAGALGALPPAEIQAVMQLAKGRVRVSATVGDLPMEPKRICNAISTTAEAGVDIVKVGFFGGPQQIACIEAIGNLQGQGLIVVAVLFAEQGWDAEFLTRLQQAGFYGVMLDTAIKDGRHLLHHCDLANLQHFVLTARALGLHSGLAGALRDEHVQVLHDLQADYLGFRSALCESHNRRSSLSVVRLQAIKNLLFKCNTSRQDALLA